MLIFTDRLAIARSLFHAKAMRVWAIATVFEQGDLSPGFNQNDQD
jgi:hypothetical protein